MLAWVPIDYEVMESADGCRVFSEQATATPIHVPVRDLSIGTERSGRGTFASVLVGIGRRPHMRDSTQASVCSTVAAYFDVDPTHVKPEQWLRSDWGLDTIELNVLAMRIEQVEGIEIRSQDLDAVQTVGQLITLVRALHRRAELEQGAG
jgi:acyl carrier protein